MSHASIQINAGDVLRNQTKVTSRSPHFQSSLPICQGMSSQQVVLNDMVMPTAISPNTQTPCRQFPPSVPPLSTVATCTFPPLLCTQNSCSRALGAFPGDRWLAERYLNFLLYPLSTPYAKLRLCRAFRYRGSTYIQKLAASMMLLHTYLSFHQDLFPCLGLNAGMHRGIVKGREGLRSFRRRTLTREWHLHLGTGSVDAW